MIMAAKISLTIDGEDRERTSTEYAAVLLTVVRTLELYWTPDIQRRAEYAHAVQQLIGWRDDPDTDISPEYRALMEADYARGPEVA